MYYSSYAGYRSTTLEDIYRQYEQMQDREGPKIDDADVEDDSEEYEGEVTGYAAVPANTGGHPNRGAPSKTGYGGSGSGGEYGHSGYGSSGTYCKIYESRSI